MIPMICNVNDFQKYCDNMIKTMLHFSDGDLVDVAQVLLCARNTGKMIFAFGNGGSGAMASHLVGDLLKGMSYDVERKFRAICLNDNIPALLAYANDVAYEDVFCEQLKNFVQKNDVVLGISGSGNSQNIVKALEYAKQIGAITIALSGFDGGKIKKIAHFNLHAKIDDMDIVENVHVFFWHYIKRLITIEIQKERRG